MFKDLMKERGITEADLANDPELIQTKIYRNMSIRFSDGLAIDMLLVGAKNSKTNGLGYLKDSKYYFAQLYKMHPEYFSEANIARIKSGRNL